MAEETLSIGDWMYALATRLWPINRSITGDGVRTTLRMLQAELPSLNIHEVPSGTDAFDWTVPEEWNVREAWIEGPDGSRVVDFADHNLHLVGYSEPVDASLTLDDLQAHLYSLPEHPEAIPYVTSYYARRWGFCLRHRDRERLRPGRYRVHIDSVLAPGSLTYADLIIPGETKSEILLSTYVCHPSMANNELSGPCVVAALGKWLSAKASRRYTYRIVFVPETIGAIVYLSRHLPHLKQSVAAGFVVTCVGDDRGYAYVPSRTGGTLADRALQHVLKHLAPDYRRLTFLDRGSDERQYCFPGVDLPVATLMRSRPGDYPEYHTSLDDLRLITPTGLEGGYRALERTIQAIEDDCYPAVTVTCEPNLGKRGLYRTLGTADAGERAMRMLHLLAYADGTRSLLDLADLFGVPIWELAVTYSILAQQGLLTPREATAASNGGT